MQAATTCSNFTGGKSPCANLDPISFLIAAVSCVLAAVFVYPHRDKSFFSIRSRSEAHRRFIGAADLRRIFQSRRQTPIVARLLAGFFAFPDPGLSAFISRIVLGRTCATAYASVFAVVLLFSGCANVGISIRPPAVVHCEADLDFSTVIAPLSGWLRSKNLPDFSLQPSDSPTEFGLTK